MFGKDHTIDSFTGKYFFLSNFYVAEVEYEGLMYKSTEHSYQAAKSTNKEDLEFIRSTETPGQSKRMARKIEIRKDWDSHKLVAMRHSLRDKFTRHKDLKQKLLNTGEAYLIEGNTWGDKFWGVCDGEGCNYLGRMLMNLRKDLRNNI